MQYRRSLALRSQEHSRSQGRQSRNFFLVVAVRVAYYGYMLTCKTPSYPCPVYSLYLAHVNSGCPSTLSHTIAIVSRQPSLHLPSRHVTDGTNCSQRSTSPCPPPPRHVKCSMYDLGLCVSQCVCVSGADLGGGGGFRGLQPPPPNESEQPHQTTERPSIAWASSKPSSR